MFCSFSDQGDSSEKDTSKQVPLQTESALLSKETVVADDPVKLDDKLVPVSHDSLGRQAGVHTSVPMAMTRAESMKIVTSANEAKEIETPRSVVSDSNEERGEGWSFKIDGLSDNKQGASGDDVKENIFVGVDEYNISQESLLDKWFGRTKPGQVSGKDGLLPSHPLADEVIFHLTYIILLRFSPSGRHLKEAQETDNSCSQDDVSSSFNRQMKLLCSVFAGHECPRVRIRDMCW